MQSIIDVPVKHKAEVVSTLASSEQWDVLFEFDQLHTHLRNLEVKSTAYLFR